MRMFMAGPISDTSPCTGAEGANERQAASWHALSLETQLWIEVSLLVALGLVMIFSASSIMALKRFSDPAHYMKRHFMYMLVGMAVMVLMSRFNYRRSLDLMGVLLITTLFSLLLVLIPGVGVELNGARRWFTLGTFLLQPAEFAKVLWIVYLCASLVKKQDRIKSLRISFWPHMLLCGLIGLLLLKQPDFGTTFMIGCLTVIMLAAGGVPLRSLLICAPFAGFGFYKYVYLVPYRWERVTAFSNPWTDPLDSGYQLIQAWIAVGSGGFFGKGLGAGQQKMFYLPESFTDFILAVIGEELGFVGILAVCVIFFFLFQTGLRISRNAPDLLGVLLALGLTMLLSLQALLNMGVVLGLVPTKGMPLPFISYGGSAFTANCIAVGMLMNIARNSGTRRIE